MMDGQRHRNRQRRGAGLAILCGLTSTLLLPIARAEPTTTVEDVVIRSRQFIPSPTILRVNHPVQLVFRNEDSELHSVVPNQWLDGVNVAVSGNGAPQFGPTGLRRVMIPSGGHASLEFTPRRPGLYQYRCDMPGHEMQAMIEVRE